jgi:hypothetical protein
MELATPLKNPEFGFSIDRSRPAVGQPSQARAWGRVGHLGEPFLSIKIRAALKLGATWTKLVLKGAGRDTHPEFRWTRAEGSRRWALVDPLR